MRDYKESKSPKRLNKLMNLFWSDPITPQSTSEEDDSNHNGSSSSPSSGSTTTSPDYSSDMNHEVSTSTSSPYTYNLSPWNPGAMPSPFTKSPWVCFGGFLDEGPATGLVGSLVREEGHVYSLAASGDLLFTGSESKNIRVWKNQHEFTGFKSSSGFVKAMVISDGKIFTGHQDGKIRVWQVSCKDPTVYKRVASLPLMKDFIKSSINPSNYVEVRRHHNTVWIRHFDAVSCLSLDEEAGLLYSGSWDKTVKVWRLSDFKCLESIIAHDDAVNTVAVGSDGLVFTGSADGTMKVWRRETTKRRKGGITTRHTLVKTLLQGESAVTSIAVSLETGVVYAGSSDGKVSFWDMHRRFAYGSVLRGHKMAVLCLAVSGRVLVSGSADKTLCVWKREEKGKNTHTKLTVLAGHDGPVKCVAVEKDRHQTGTDWGQRWVVYSGSLDRSVKVWRVAEYMEPQLETGSKTPPGHVTVGGRSPLHVQHVPFVVGGPYGVRYNCQYYQKSYYQ